MKQLLLIFSNVKPKGKVILECIGVIQGSLGSAAVKFTGNLSDQLLGS